MVNCLYCGNEIPRAQVPIPVKGGMICLRCKELPTRFPGGPAGMWVVPMGDGNAILALNSTNLVAQLMDNGFVDDPIHGIRSMPVIGQDFRCGDALAVWCPSLMTLKEAIRYAERRQPHCESVDD